MRNLLKSAALAGASLMLTGMASAALVTALTGGTVIPLAALNVYGNGPVAIAPGITWTSFDNFAEAGWTGRHGLGVNGYWEGPAPFYGLEVGDGTSRITMTWAFDTPVSGVGGIINYAPGAGDLDITSSIEVLDSAFNPLEHYDLTISAPISTPGGINQGVFLAIDRVGNDISYFRVRNDALVLRNLTVQFDPPLDVPEPMTGSLLGAGLAGMAFMRRRRL
ncbi:PEP-CTERM sorting domain-containing protein [Rhodoferax sp.]|uniref:PEP-CTERM sorting domain-containing protein n=1 Tax=Rhodoferax sp. TaxID=50421 RepID=UPI00374CE62D